jgi:lipoyl(octanoyl) transferase
MPLAGPSHFRRADDAPVAWLTATTPVAYPEAVAAMERRVTAIADRTAGECVWMLEHPSLYTAGVSAKPVDLLQPGRLPVFASGRGGQYTYHGPGQRVAYVMLDLRARRQDVRAYVVALEAWIIAALARLGVTGAIRSGRVGVWVEQPGGTGEDKIAAIGVKLRRWVSFHGVSVNADPDLTHFAGIVPCGVSDHGVTSLAKLGAPAGLAEVDAALAAAFGEIFGPSAPAEGTP